MTDEKRIYVVVAETVYSPVVGDVDQCCGRVAAQCAHVVSKMQVERLHCAQDETDVLDMNNNDLLRPCTTIILAARGQSGTASRDQPDPEAYEHQVCGVQRHES